MFIRQHREGLICAALVVAVTLVAWLSWKYDADRRADREPFHAEDHATATPDAGRDGERDRDRDKGKQRKRDRAGSAEEAMPAGLPGLPGMGGVGWSGAADLPPGYDGDGWGASIPSHTLRITVSSSEAIRKVGYQVPTSKNHKSGIANGVGTSWGLSTTVYGNPDYARVFLQAGPSGAAITCTITVDGRVTESRSTQGPYGATMCQG